MAIKRIRSDGPPISGDGWRWDYNLFRAIEIMSREQKAMRDEKLALAAFFDRHPDLKREFAASMKTTRPRTFKDLLRAIEAEHEDSLRKEREARRRLDALRAARERGDI